MNLIKDPIEIEEKSFEIISKTIGDKYINPKYANIIKRAIHTSADFDYLDNLVFSENIIEVFKDAILNKAIIVTDTQMAMSGINKKALKKAELEIKCFISDENVAKIAKEKGLTRSNVAVEYAFSTIDKPIIFVCGNAPTALIKICELVDSKKYTPKMVVAVPVGFVNVVESKEMILERDVPYIVAKGRKGGSNIAASIINALLYEIVGRD